MTRAQPNTEYFSQSYVSYLFTYLITSLFIYLFTTYLPRRSVVC